MYLRYCTNSLTVASVSPSLMVIKLSLHVDQTRHGCNYVIPYTMHFVAIPTHVSGMYDLLYPAGGQVLE